MADSTRTAFQHHRTLRQSSDPRPPHPSWRQTIAGTGNNTARIVSASDFWARLGI